MTNNPQYIETTELYGVSVDAAADNVAVPGYTGAYIVTNLLTGIAELQCTQLPEALASMHALTEALENRPWEWSRPVNPDGSPQEVH